ncbi:hypothetical protein LR48_Vigan11g105500 [Vigna angularis]|uniref:Uncharacterized protein n=1 Tax=Phaseolus angularis TaxID=3914 RepID=A0A0L9VT51_PHAAN|nr:hypothetical protein LR48_Vigan11g105500 [Vigna angularis]
MTGQGSERPDKGKGVARPKKRQRQAPKYVLRVPAKLPTTAAPSPSSVGPPPTPTIQPPTPAVDPTPTSAIHYSPTPIVHPSPTPATHPSPTPAAHPSPTSTAHPLPPPVIINPTPPPVLITLTPPPDPTSIPSSSCIPPSETVTPSTDPDSTGDGEGVDPPLHDRPWIEPYGKGWRCSGNLNMKHKYKEISTFKHIIGCQRCLGMLAMQESALTGWASTFGTLYWLIGIQ